MYCRYCWRWGKNGPSKQNSVCSYFKQLTNQDDGCHLCQAIDYKKIRKDENIDYDEIIKLSNKIIKKTKNIKYYYIPIR